MKTNPLIIDASNALLGRLASYAAKQVLLGRDVIIFNCEKAVISGSSAFIKENYRVRRARGGSSLKGPNFPRSPERIVKRTIRGMLPYQQARGLAAFKRVRCYNEVPEAYKNASVIHAGKEKPIRTMSLGGLSKNL